MRLIKPYPFLHLRLRWLPKGVIQLLKHPKRRPQVRILHQGKITRHIIRERLKRRIMFLPDFNKGLVQLREDKTHPHQGRQQGHHRLPTSGFSNRRTDLHRGLMRLAILLSQVIWLLYHKRAGANAALLTDGLPLAVLRYGWYHVGHPLGVEQDQAECGLEWTGYVSVCTVGAYFVCRG